MKEGKGGEKGHKFETIKTDGTFSYDQIYCKTDHGSKTSTNSKKEHGAADSPG